MATAVPPLAAPVGFSDRYLVMDVLRGFALLGVLVVNLTGLAGGDFMTTPLQLESLPSAEADRATYLVIELFLEDKANTLFAFLFGVGFWVQMERLEARGASFRTIYLRRAGILFLFGLVHLFGLFTWDVLHLYGAVAFILFFSRKLPDKVMLWIGLVLVVAGKPLTMWALSALGVADPAFDRAYSVNAVLERQAAALSGDYFSWIASMDFLTAYDWIASGLFLGWILYVLGRFYLGAWVARQKWIQKADDHLPMYRRWVWPLLLAGILMEGLRAALNAVPDEYWTGPVPYLSDALHAVATPLTAAGYVCGFVLLFHGGKHRWLVKALAPVGQMALTNYLLQSVAIMLVLTRIGPGLGLAGKAGTMTYVLIALAVFVAQAVLSHFWMRAFAYGPCEWVWRTLTYGKPPAFRREGQPIRRKPSHPEL